MTPYLQQSAPQGRVVTARGEHQQLLRHHKAQRRPHCPSLQMPFHHQRLQLALEFHRSAETNVPLTLERFVRSGSGFLGRTHTARVRAAVPVAMPVAQRLGRWRYIGFPRLPRARGQFTPQN